MAVKLFGTHNGNTETPKPRDYMAEVYELVGVNFPIQISMDRDNNLIGASYSTEWKEGGTEPVIDRRGNVLDHEESYENKKLTKDQIKQIDAFINENIVKPE